MYTNIYTRYGILFTGYVGWRVDILAEDSFPTTLNLF